MSWTESEEVKRTDALVHIYFKKVKTNLNSQTDVWKNTEPQNVILNVFEGKYLKKKKKQNLLNHH